MVFRAHTADAHMMAVEDAGTLPLLREACRQSFHAHGKPLIRFHLLREDAKRWALLIVASHLVFDGPSKAVFAQDLCHRYAMLSTEGHRELGPVDVDDRYASYSRQAAMKARRSLSRIRSDRQLIDTLNVGRHTLPLDYPRQGSLQRVGDVVEFRLGARVTRELERFATEHGSTVFRVLLTAWIALSGRPWRAQDARRDSGLPRAADRRHGYRSPS